MMAAEVGFYDGVEYLIENCTVDVDARDAVSLNCPHNFAKQLFVLLVWLYCIAMGGPSRPLPNSEVSGGIWLRQCQRANIRSKHLRLCLLLRSIIYNMSLERHYWFD